MVAGLDPFTGRVFYDDQDMASAPPKDRGIGMVFQSYALYPQFESRGNLSFFFKMHRAPDGETEERIRVTSEIMGIGFKELLARKPRVLSGGQQQRVAIARAIVRKPRLFLFDEPLSNLDAKLRAQTRIEINRLFRRFEITAVYVTHDQSEAIMLGDQIAVMRAGTIEQVGTYQELMRRPDNAFVAGFLGVQPMNLLHGGIVADGVLRLEKIEIPLPEPLRSQTHAGQEMILGVRPQAARITQHDEAVSQGIHVPGIVEGVEPDFEHDIQLAYLRTGTLSYAASTTIDTRSKSEMRAGSCFRPINSTSSTARPSNASADGSFRRNVSARGVALFATKTQSRRATRWPSIRVPGGMVSVSGMRSSTGTGWSSRGLPRLWSRGNTRRCESSPPSRICGRKGSILRRCLGRWW